VNPVETVSRIECTEGTSLGVNETAAAGLNSTYVSNAFRTPLRYLIARI